MRIAILTASAVLACYAEMPEQAKRGSELFFKSSKGLPCATCHEMEGKGTPAGPDLKNIAVVGARGIVMAIRATRTAYVQEVELQTGKKYTIMQHRETPEEIICYDLNAGDGKKPAELKLKKVHIKRVRDNAAWKHPPESAGYTDQELADVIAYIKYTARGSTDPIGADDVKK
jgi:cytochrome c2